MQFAFNDSALEPLMPNIDDNFSTALQFSKPASSSARGMVTAQHKQAAQLGAQVLRDGGDCVDAAVAMSFALGALEPWMSGLGAIGSMVIYRAGQQTTEVIDFGGVSPAHLKASDYPLDAKGVASGLFPWPRVKDDRNLHGPMSVVVPGVVAGMAKLHQRYGKMAWPALLKPSVALAHKGLLVDWFTTECIASAAIDLRSYPAAASEFLIDGLPPSAQWGARAQLRLPRTHYAQTIDRIAMAGAKDFYCGDLARDMVKELADAGGSLSIEDLTRYWNSFEQRCVNPLTIPYKGHQVFVSPELTAGPTLAHALKHLADWSPAGGLPDASDYAAWASALQTAYQQRLNDMGDADERRSIGSEHLRPSCTTHFNVVDELGNMVAVTQTLLGIFGSRFVGPNTGVLWNNGIMWFDPVAGKANSLAAGKRCLSNYTPLLARRADGAMLALGASGGRRILPAVMQVLSMVNDFKLPLGKAFDLPRIDASEGSLVLGDARLSDDIHAQLAQRFDYEPVRQQNLPLKFACPGAILRSPDGQCSGATETFSPWAEAIGV
jgi:gamma-glutamyltranspeptidase / glutathione hydrolase